MFRDDKKLGPLLKYPGGKNSELENIFKFAPKEINNYIEPFVGGGAVYFATKSKRYFINDISQELMLLYKYVKEENEDFFKQIETIDNNWNLLKEISENIFLKLKEIFLEHKKMSLNIQGVEEKVNILINDLNGSFNEQMFELESIKSNVFKKYLIKSISNKIIRMKSNEIKKEIELDEKSLKDNFESAIKAAYYMHFRELYNSPLIHKVNAIKRTAIFFFIREYCYSSMFRFNRNNEFNVPYGGISYNKKSLTGKINYFKSKILLEKLSNTELGNKDFYDFVQDIKISEKDFMFLDPPYDTVFSEYDRNKFDKNDQQRLADYLKNKCKCKFMLVIKKTDYIEQLYKDSDFNIIEVQKNYLVSFKNRNKKDVVHLIIRNY